VPAALRWLSDLLPTNPLAARLVLGAGRRARDLGLRAGVLGGLMAVVIILSLPGSDGSLREMAQSGARAFTLISYGQLAAICLLTPLFMAGAIAQESNPRTWEILVTTPLNSLQIVLGNLAGRLFFAFALLLSVLPLCILVRLFGGVRAGGVLASLGVSACSALFLGSVAVSLGVMRSAGKRGVVAFYAATVLTLFATAAADRALQRPVAVGLDAVHTTIMTPLNPFLALRSELNADAYRPWDLGAADAGWLTRLWLGRPLMAMTLSASVASLLLLIMATLRVRLVGARSEASTGGLSRFLRRVSRKGERPPRRVWQNPVAWREASLRLSTPLAGIGRWVVLAMGMVAAVTILAMHRSGALDTLSTRLALGGLVMGEVVLALLVAISASATAVSREREDGSLDILLTTPIQPGPYLGGKLRGLLAALWPALAAPTLTLLMGAAYVAVGGLGAASVTTPNIVGTMKIEEPLVLVPAAIAFGPSFGAFMAFACMCGLSWSVGSKGVIGSTVGALGVVAATVLVLGLCGLATGREIPVVGPVIICLTPVNLAWAAVSPASAIPGQLEKPEGMLVAFAVGCVIAVSAFTVTTMLMHAALQRNFMMTVRRLAGMK
jgi:ABC-type transport system involved in multi-copper enzyme maturation permease subunit